MRLADISWPSGRERAAECIPGPTERTFVYRLTPAGDLAGVSFIFGDNAL